MVVIAVMIASVVGITAMEVSSDNIPEEPGFAGIETQEYTFSEDADDPCADNEIGIKATLVSAPKADHIYVLGDGGKVNKTVWDDPSSQIGDTKYLANEVVGNGNPPY